MTAYPNRSNTFCTHPPQLTLGCPPSHIPQCATHPSLPCIQGTLILLLPLLFGSFSSRPATAHLKFAFHKSQETRVCKNVSPKTRADVGMVQCVAEGHGKPPGRKKRIGTRRRAGPCKEDGQPIHANPDH